MANVLLQYDYMEIDTFTVTAFKLGPYNYDQKTRIAKKSFIFVRGSPNTPIELIQSNRSLAFNVILLMS